MTEAMDALYLYAQEHTLRLFLAQDEGYTVRLNRADEYEKRLRALLDEPEQKLLDDLSQTRFNIFGTECDAAFQAGFHCALELLR